MGTSTETIKHGIKMDTYLHLRFITKVKGKEYTKSGTKMVYLFKFQ